MIRSSLRLLLVIAGLAVPLVTPAAITSAQTPPQAVTVSPASARLSLDAGTSLSKTMDVINSGTNPLSVEFSVAPYHVTGEHYDPQFTQLPGTVDASKWVTLDTNSSTVEGQRVLSITYKVTVPENTAPGGYYAVIFTNTTQEGNNTNGIVPQSRVGSILYITVNGEVKISGHVTGNPLPLFSFSPTVPLGVKVSNDGGVHFESKVSFRVTDIYGKEVVKQDSERMILPSTVRDISIDWQNPVPFGIFTVERQATIGSDVVTLEKQTVTIISPWFLICVIIFLGSLITLFVLRIQQRKKGK